MRYLGIIFIILGILLLGHGLRETFSQTEKVVEAISGETEKQDYKGQYIIAGAALILAGGGLMLLRRPIP